MIKNIETAIAEMSLAKRVGVWQVASEFMGILADRPVLPEELKSFADKISGKASCDIGLEVLSLCLLPKGDPSAPIYVDLIARKIDGALPSKLPGHA